MKMVVRGQLCEMVKETHMRTFSHLDKTHFVRSR